MQKEVGYSGHSPRSLSLILRWLIGAHGHVDRRGPLRGAPSAHSERTPKAKLLVVLLTLHTERRPPRSKIKPGEVTN